MLRCALGLCKLALKKMTLKFLTLGLRNCKYRQEAYIGYNLQWLSMVILILEREEERKGGRVWEGEGERNINRLPPVHTPAATGKAGSIKSRGKVTRDSEIKRKSESGVRWNPFSGMQRRELFIGKVRPYLLSKL